MGFEIHYKFREEITKGEYSEEIKEKVVKVGSPDEELPVENAASKIMAQLARRNILIVDVEIYEFTKKKLAYKETDDGIVIKNKKFKFDDGPAISTEIIDENSEVAALLANPNILAQLQKIVGGNKQPHELMREELLAKAKLNSNSNNSKKVRRQEEYSPNPRLDAQNRAQGMKFTMGKRYPILEEIQKGLKDMARTFYLVRDDSGTEVEVGAESFMPIVSGKLSFEEEMRDSRDPGIPLDWGGANEIMDMPKLR